MMPCLHLLSSRQSWAITATFSGTGHCYYWLLYGASYKEYLQRSGLYQELGPNKISSDSYTGYSGYDVNASDVW